MIRFHLAKLDFSPFGDLNTKERADRSVTSYSRDDFTAPVEDYDFATIDTPRSLIDQMARAGGFTATKLAHARDKFARECFAVLHGHELRCLVQRSLGRGCDD